MVGLPNDTLIAGASAPWSFDGSFRRVWISCKRDIGGSWINPLNFFVYVDMSGTDLSQYKVLKVGTLLIQRDKE
jgi:primary-amine oxidase